MGHGSPDKAWPRLRQPLWCPSFSSLSALSSRPTQATTELGSDINVPVSFASKDKVFGAPQLTGGETGLEGVFLQVYPKALLCSIMP